MHKCSDEHKKKVMQGCVVLAVDLTQGVRLKGTGSHVVIHHIDILWSLFPLVSALQQLNLLTSLYCNRPFFCAYLVQANQIYLDILALIHQSAHLDCEHVTVNT